MTTRADTIKLPILDYSDEDWTVLFMASESQRHRLVDKLWEQYPEVPPAPGPWAETPLIRWSWLILKLNGLDVDPDEHKPIIHWGIDMGMTSHDVRKWVWIIA